MADNRKLARLVAGLPAYAQPFTGLRNEPALPNFDISNLLSMKRMVDGNTPFQLPQEARAQLPDPQAMPAYQAPYAGLHNEPYGPSPSRQGNYGEAMQPPMSMPASAPAQMPQPDPNAWLALTDQSRTAAFDPMKDFSDPNNMHAVDQFGQFLPKRGLLGPV